MNDKDSKESSGTTAIIIVVAVLLLGLPCLAVVGLFGAGVLFYSNGARDVPRAVDSAPMIQDSPPPPAEPPLPAQAAPDESAAPMPQEQKDG
jgi:hypothetical protein